jgi:hypothetical protein
MNSQTFASPSVGMVAGRAFAGVLTVIAGIGQSVWDSLAALGQQRARNELLRMADGFARTDPEQAARLRVAARRNWYGDV